MYVDDFKMVGKRHNLDPMWKISMTQIVLAKSTRFLDQVYSGCTQRECQPNDEYRQMFDSHIPQELLESCSVRREVNANSAAWSYDMEGHATKNIDQLCEVSTLFVSMITSSNRKSWRQWEKCHKFALKSS